MYREKRRYPRIGPVRLRCHFRFGKKTQEGCLTSVSEGGAYLVTDERIRVGETLSLQLVLPYQQGEIETEAKVVYIISDSDPGLASYAPGAGLVFVDLSDNGKESIREYVSR